jgi:hypothetical protein
VPAPPPISATITALTCGTTYHFRARAQSTVATVVAADQSFATSACAPPPPPPSGQWPWPTWTNQVIAVPPSSTGTTYYVDGTNGNNNNIGTSQSAPFRTIARTLPLVAAGDTVLIKKGLYREGINLSSSSSGAAGKTDHVRLVR